MSVTGVVVTHQIVDEYRWQLALREVASLFAGQSFFHHLLPEDCNPSCIGIDLHRLLRAGSGFQRLAGEPQLLENILGWVYQDDPLSPERLRHLNLTESLNFGALQGQFNDLKSLRSWHTFKVPHSCQQLRMRTKMCFDDLACEHQRLENQLQINSKAESVEYEYGLEDSVRELQLLMQQLEGRAECEQQELLQLGNKLRYHCPPSIYCFAFADHPCLPMFARHFKAFVSKVSTHGSSCMTTVVEQVCRILVGFFPQNLQFHRKSLDGSEQLTKILQLPHEQQLQSGITQSQFYKRLRAVQHPTGAVAFVFDLCCNCGIALSSQNCKKCSKCKIVQYCSQTCQRNGWRSHKVECLAV